MGKVVKGESSYKGSYKGSYRYRRGNYKGGRGDIGWGGFRRPI